MGAKIDELKQAFARGGCAEVDRLIPDLVNAFATPADHDEEVRETLDLLRSNCCFPALDELSASLAKTASGPLSIFIRRQLAQAKLDRERLDEAFDILTGLSAEVQGCGSDTDRSEVTGLLGRLYKQRFVRAIASGKDGAEELQKAVACYASVFDLDPAWHGANLIALAVRAERAGIRIDGGSAKDWAERLLKRLNALGRAAWSPWAFSAAGDAYLILGNEERSAECFRKYWSSPTVDAFALGGTARQLREIWQAETRSDPFLSSLLRQIDTRLLGRPGGRAEWSGGDLSELAAGIGSDLSDRHRAEALFGRGSTIPLRKVLRLIRHAGSICQIYDRRDRDAGGATGFLVDGARFGLQAESLLLTNHHVLSKADDILDHPDYAGCIELQHAEARFTYWGGEEVERTFAIKEILDHSTRPEIDFTLASLSAPVPQAMALPICTADKPLRSRNFVGSGLRSKVLVVGHPRGESLTFSLDDTAVVDHELDGQPCPGPRRIHYRTSTDRGNSGSPVFQSDTLEVVGLHRTGRAGPLQAEWPGKRPGDVYEANEAVWIGSVSEYVRRPRGHPIAHRD